MNPEYYRYTINLPVSDLEVLYEFKQYVISKFGSLNGYLGKELLNALSFYLDNTSKNERIFKTKHEQTKAIKYANLLINYKEITLKDLKKLISQYFGADERTIRKYIKLAMSLNFISLKIDKGFTNKIYNVHEGNIRRFLGEEFFEDKKQHRVKLSQKLKELKKTQEVKYQENKSEYSELELLLSAQPVR